VEAFIPFVSGRFQPLFEIKFSGKEATKNKLDEHKNS